MRFKTLRGAISKGVPSLWKASWITCAVGSLAQGTTASVEKSGRKIEVAVGEALGESLLLLRIFAGDGLGEHRGRQRHRIAAEEFRRRHQLAAGDARLVGDDALDVVDAAGAAPLARGRLVGNAARGEGGLFGYSAVTVMRDD